MPSQKFQRKIEDFVCENCGKQIFGSGYTNHCPWCLWSKHVDNYPGDRASSCGGLMKPLGILLEGKETIIVQQCQLCQKMAKIKAAKNDNQEEIIKLSKNILANIR